ncbi:MAG: thiamine pyrophosphate-binding protein [Deltaproteobacteria bacterium]|nr:thiamine pyrophosphate-binding protein [Deltaproteobacteria bacterium]
MDTTDGGELFVRALESAGIRTLFTLHGGHLDAIYQAAKDRGLRLVDTRHEQAAGHAADGWARVTGQTGVALVTAGPGLTDCITAIANARLDCVPTLFVAGAAPLRDAELLPLQGGFDQLALVTPITKWAHRVTHTHRIPDLVAQALRIARSGRPGPVYLELPIDVLFARTDAARVRRPAKVAPDAPPAPPAVAVEQAIAWLHGAERPAIVVGGGARFAEAAGELTAFAEETGIPVFSNGRGHGLVPAGHPLCGRGLPHLAFLGRAGGGGDADVVLVLGARLGLFTGHPAHPLIPAAARLIQVDVCAEEIGRNRDVELGIVADCREALVALRAAAKGRRWPEGTAWQQAVRGVREGHRMLFAQALASESGPVHPYRLVSEIVKRLPQDAIVTADGGETASWMEMVAEVHAPGRFLSHGYLGCLGTGLPFALAAQVAHPGSPVLCIVGDGSVGLNFAEFDTFVRHGLPIVTVIANDGQWGMSAHGQELLFGPGRRVVTDLAPTRYDLAAAGFGCHAEHVESPRELGPALERAFASGKPACVDVRVDPAVIAPITLAMVGAARAPSGGAAPAQGVRIPYYGDLDA